MSILREIQELLESAKSKKERKIQAKKDSKLTGKAKELKELGFDFAEDKGWEDYLTDIGHWKKLVDKKGYQSVIAGMNTAINSYADSENPNKNLDLSKKIETLRDKVMRAFNRDDKDTSNDKFGKFDRQKK